LAWDLYKSPQRAKEPRERGNEMDLQIAIDQELQLVGKKYWVIGIDSYVLDNFLDERRAWKSYTLKNSAGENAWISKADDENYFIEWRAISAVDFKKAATMALNLELSGIAKITFLGERGYSTPLAETLYFNAENKEYDFLASERFLEYENQCLIPRQSVYMIGKRLEPSSVLFKQKLL
jgi:hypothetical protein